MTPHASHASHAVIGCANPKGRWITMHRYLINLLWQSVCLHGSQTFEKVPHACSVPRGGDEYVEHAEKHQVVRTFCFSKPLLCMHRVYTYTYTNQLSTAPVT